MKTIYLLRPISKKAKRWVKDHIQTEPYKWLGKALAVEWRYVDQIVEAMITDGLKNGKDFEVI